MGLGLCFRAVDRRLPRLTLEPTFLRFVLPALVRFFSLRVYLRFTTEPFLARFDRERRALPRRLPAFLDFVLPLRDFFDFRFFDFFFFFPFFFFLPFFFPFFDRRKRLRRDFPRLERRAFMRFNARL